MKRKELDQVRMRFVPKQSANTSTPDPQKLIKKGLADPLALTKMIEESFQNTVL